MRNVVNALPSLLRALDRRSLSFPDAVRGRDGGLDPADKGLRALDGALRTQDAGFFAFPAARILRMAAREDKMVTRERWMAVREDKKLAGNVGWPLGNAR